VQQKQDIKGFTILELLVVITIVAVVSAVGYPNFMNWREDREMRASMEKVSSMLRSINTQSLRGNFAVVQFMVKPSTKSVEFFSKGMSKSAESTITNTAGQNVTCQIVNSGYWTNHQVEYSQNDVSTNIDGEGAVCFSKDTRYFLKEGKLSNLLNVSIDGKLTNNYIILCTTKNATKTGGKCATTQGDGLEKPAYLVEWNRFGKISKFKWSGSVWSRL
tara:strand:+ start:666 stop:1319 length:654 start_codon:yes stop_codon:yes gene_type:complete